MAELLPGVPKSVGIIMDGNRRFAKQAGKALLEGHRAGYETLKEIARASRDAGVEVLTVYAFSTENWKRSKEEVGYLMDLLRYVLRKELGELMKEGIRIRYIGDLSRLDKDLQEDVARAEKETAHNTKLTLQTCLSYGGRDEILHAVRTLIAEKVDPASITPELFASKLYTAGYPDPDLIIRTSGEQRLSGFLTWQGVYSELFFTDTLWPAFTKEEYLGILKEYGERERRLGR